MFVIFNVCELVFKDEYCHLVSFVFVLESNVFC